MPPPTPEHERTLNRLRPQPGILPHDDFFRCGDRWQWRSVLLAVGVAGAGRPVHRRVTAASGGSAVGRVWCVLAGRVRVLVHQGLRPGLPEDDPGLARAAGPAADAAGEARAVVAVGRRRAVAGVAWSPGGGAGRDHEFGAAPAA